ncbi:lytic transglycosylase domain-containing protein [Novosphingobium rosa]|uniref:lytic transglycosylase domain-containing protein n=1 Tax=Novosphingobium rosa TaxID=76978 RepID=UPI000834CE05|nr:lytic transglycosylase domain-containing protein [Novosphingobium rosa]
MGALKTAMLALALALGGTASSARADDVTRWRPLIAEASTRFGLPEAWIEQVIAAESAGQLIWRGKPITSAAGAMGLMQLMPATWVTMRRQLGLGSDPHNPRDNILAGSCYLRLMYDRFGYPGLFAAYNAGPGRYTSYLAGLRPLPAETRNYVFQTAGHRAGRPGARSTQVAFRSDPTYAAPSPPHGDKPSIFFPLSGARPDGMRSP